MISEHPGSAPTGYAFKLERYTGAQKRRFRPMKRALDMRGHVIIYKQYPQPPPQL